MIPEAVVERAMKIQEVILRAMAKRITWWQAAEIMGISERQMRRRRRRYEKCGSDGLWDGRYGRASPEILLTWAITIDAVAHLCVEERRTSNSSLTVRHYALN